MSCKRKRNVCVGSSSHDAAPSLADVAARSYEGNPFDEILSTQPQKVWCPGCSCNTRPHKITRQCPVPAAHFAACQGCVGELGYHEVKTTCPCYITARTEAHASKKGVMCVQSWVMDTQEHKWITAWGFVFLAYVLGCGGKRNTNFELHAADGLPVMKVAYKPIYKDKHEQKKDVVVFKCAWKLKSEDYPREMSPEALTKNMSVTWKRNSTPQKDMRLFPGEPAPGMIAYMCENAVPDVPAWFYRKEAVDATHQVNLGSCTQDFIYLPRRCQCGKQNYIYPVPYCLELFHKLCTQ